MKLFAALALFALPISLLAAPVPKEVVKEEKTEGTWQLESLLAYGRPINFGAGNRQHWTIDAEGHVINHQGPVPPENARKAIQLVFEPKARAVDYKYTNGQNTSYPGMYELTGDTLKISCNLKGTGVRPTTVDAGPDVYLWTFQRAKPGEKK